jgi:EAL domain-containing protein (putative c-di-GMP-specific phosphodiesterase class I)/GGDEF domain-containing protein
MDEQCTARRAETDALWEWNLVSNRIHYSPRWLSLIGCDEHEVCSTPDEWFHRVHPDDQALVQGELEAARGDGRRAFAFDHRLRHKNGSYRWMACRGAVDRDDGGTATRLTGTLVDVTGDHSADPATGLPNERLLSERIRQSIERSRRQPAFRFALLLLEVGADAAADSAPEPIDRPVLAAVARRLETGLRVRDLPSAAHADIVARAGSRRFAVLLDGLKDLCDAKAIGDRILSEVLAPLTIAGRQAFVGASAGIAVSDTGYATAEAMMRDAESALHRAHVLGGSRCEMFDTAILDREHAELALERDMAKALDRGEFLLLYQPVVSIVSNTIIGFEALARWEHPERGTIAPSEFIPIAERTGFIVRLGRWVLEQACAQMKTWQETVPAPRVWVSVNLSSVQLNDPGIVSHVAEALRQSGLDPRSLVLELTEGSAMQNPGAVRSILMDLRAAGIRVSVDDFGTGYSSLAYLRQFPVDCLKVDRAFVRTLETDKDAATILGSLTTMARQLGLHVIAEGIETVEQLSVLRRLDCELVQGYLFAKPLAADAARQMLESRMPALAGEAAAGADSAAPAATTWAFAAVPRPTTPHARLAIAATALAIIASAGIAARFRAVSEHGAAVPRVEQAATRPGHDIPLPANTAKGERTTTTPKPPAAPAPPRPAAAAEKPRSAGNAARSPAAPDASSSRSTAVAVEHLHRIGSCRGTLTASSLGVQFVPDDRGDKDAFVLKLSEFRQMLDSTTLTLKSAERTYRFRATDAAGTSALRALAGTVAEMQRRATPDPLPAH